MGHIGVRNIYSAKRVPNFIVVTWLMAEQNRPWLLGTLGSS